MLSSVIGHCATQRTQKLISGFCNVMDQIATCSRMNGMMFLENYPSDILTKTSKIFSLQELTNCMLTSLEKVLLP